MARYRSWAERRQIVRAIIAETATRPLADFGLTESERIYFSARADQAVHRLARKTSAFKAYYELPISRPFRLVIGMATLLIVTAATVGAYIFLARRSSLHLYPLLAACGTVIVATFVGTIGAWISHRNAVRQTTNNIIFARFAQTAFTESLHRFHVVFGYEAQDRVSREMVRAVRADRDDRAKGADAAIFLLNYLEYLSAGVLCGDLDHDIVRRNMRGIIIYYYEKCEPFILAHNRENPRAFMNLIKLRTHYREP